MQSVWKVEFDIFSFSDLLKPLVLFLARLVSFSLCPSCTPLFFSFLLRVSHCVVRPIPVRDERQEAASSFGNVCPAVGGFIQGADAAPCSLSCSVPTSTSLPAVAFASCPHASPFCYACRAMLNPLLSSGSLLRSLPPVLFAQPSLATSGEFSFLLLLKPTLCVFLALLL